MTSGMFVPTAAMNARMITVPGSDITISLMRFMAPSARAAAHGPQRDRHRDRAPRRSAG